MINSVKLGISISSMVVAGIVGLVIGFAVGNFSFNKNSKQAVNLAIATCIQERELAVAAIEKDAVDREARAYDKGSKDRAELLDKQIKAAKKVKSLEAQLKNEQRKTPTPRECTISPERVRILNEALDLSSGGPG